jgi:hypothetical protein
VALSSAGTPGDCPPPLHPAASASNAAINTHQTVKTLMRRFVTLIRPLLHAHFPVSRRPFQMCPFYGKKRLAKGMPVASTKSDKNAGGGYNDSSN